MIHRRIQSRHWPLVLLGLTPLLAGCGEDAMPVGVLEAGEHTLTLLATPSLTLSRGGETLLSLDASALQLGLVGVVDDNINYDPYRLYVPMQPYDPPPDLQWRAPRKAHFSQELANPGELVLALDYGDGLSAQLTARVSAENRFELKLLPQQPERVAFLRVRATASSDEGFYGLGEWFDDVNHRGKVRAMQLELDNMIESQYNEAHVPIPLLLGTHGWGLFIPSPHPGVFAVANEKADVIEAAFGTGVDSAQGLTVHLFGDQNPIDLTRHYYDLTGYPKLPARWALGPWIWRDENDDQAQVQNDLDTIRDLDLATTGYWIDRPYATGVNTFDFNPAQFPTPTAMYQQMKALGFGTALWHTPYLDEEDPATAGLRQQVVDNGYYPPQTGVSLNSWGRPIDPTNPDAVAFWQQQLSAYIDLGVAGFKLDYGEDVVTGLFETRIVWNFADGSDERTMQSQFQRYYHAMYAPLLPADGGFLLCRAATYGEQTAGIIIWPGDLDASFAKHREQVDDGNDSYIAVGGLPASIVAGLSLGVSGLPFFGADTGGYRHAPPDKEVFMRWFEQTALSSVMQVGTNANDVPWELGGANGFDQQVLDSYRNYARLHLRLFPYLWSHANELKTHGRPLQRPLGLAHPELGKHPNDIYLLGDGLLVAPVVERGALARTVLFPAGRWLHWFSGEAFEGGSEHDVAAPLGQLPLFINENALVPLLRPTIEAMLPTDDPTRVDSYASDAGLLYVRGVAGGQGDFDLFDGGHVGTSSQATSMTLSAKPGDELNQGVIFELIDSELPSSVSGPSGALPQASDMAALESSAGAWLYQPASRTLLVKLPGSYDGATINW